MTPHEQAIRDHCQRRGIRIAVLPNQALRFVGYGVNITVAHISSVTLSNLKPYEPRDDQAVIQTKKDTYESDNNRKANRTSTVGSN